MTANKMLDKAIGLIQEAQNVLVVSHIRPDGDASGSMKAICEVCRQLGKKSWPVYLSPIASWYEFLFDEPVPVYGNDIGPEKLDELAIDLVVIVDTNSRIQLPGICKWLDAYEGKTLVIDHHVTSDHLGDVEVVDTTAAAAGEIVYSLVKHAKWPITEAMANALFVAYATDSGWFRFGNADERLFRTAAGLIEAGAVPAEIYRKLFQNYTPARVALMVRMLERLELHYDGKLAVQHILRKDFDELGAAGSDTENLIDECQRIGSVDMAVLLVELGENPDRNQSGFRCSLRSKGKVDVGSIAARHGGGGHKVAAGVNLKGDLESIRKLILEEAKAQLLD